MSRPIVNKDFIINSYKDLPIGTYASGMLLTETMEGWREEKPVINPNKCIECNVCGLVCPEGVIYEEDGVWMIDYRFCKGCGICSRECVGKCIKMVREEK